jgi:hypothetical protein
MLKFARFIILIAVAASILNASVLSTTAASMAPNSWVEITTTNINTALLSTVPGGASGHITWYADEMPWDSSTHQAFFSGSDHIYTYTPPGEKTVKYTESSNSWTVIGQAPWAAGVQHGYDGSAVDPTRHYFYHHPFTQANIQRFNITTGTWGSMPAFTFTSDITSCCGALEYFPEMDGLVYIGGAENAYGSGGDASIYLFKESTGQWTKLASNLRLTGSYYLAEYNPVLHLILFWSNGDNALYKMDASGTITQLKNPTISLYNGSTGILTVDPVSGDFIGFHSPANTSYTPYRYNVASDTWTVLGGTGAPNFGGGGVIATTIPEYGVIMFASSNGSASHAYLYKSAGSGSVTNMPKGAPVLSGVSVSPNPCLKGTVNIRTAHTSGEITILDASGRQVVSFPAAGDRTWNVKDRNNRDLPTGVYLARWTDGSDRAIYQRFTVIR